MSGTPRSRLPVAVDSPSGRHFLQVPDGARVDDLLPGLVEVCEGATDPKGWSLAPMGEAPLAGDETLGRRGLFPGAVLVLTAPNQEGNPEPESDVRPPSVSAPPPPSIDRISDADYLHLLEAAIAAPASRASTVVAVMSAHSGAGTTTMTALLATLLASLGNEQVGAVDACPQSAALSHWLAPESGLAGDTYRSLFEPSTTPEQVRGALVRIGLALTLLPAPSDSGKPLADEVAWAMLIQHLRHLHNVVILDCGAGFRGAVNRAVLGAADQVVLVSKAAPGEHPKLGPTIESIQRLGRTVVLVANQAPKRSRINRAASGVQQVTLAYEPQPAHRLKTRGFSWGDAPYSWQESIRELAAVLMGSAQPR